LTRTSRRSRTSSARLQVEVLNRRRWGIRVELANAIFEYIKCIDNWRRRHSALNWTSP
jgi:putative transposase